jgi:hypothetical protein
MQNNYYKPDVTDISSVVTVTSFDVTKNGAIVNKQKGMNFFELKWM